MWATSNEARNSCLWYGGAKLVYLDLQMLKESRTQPTIKRSRLVSNLNCLPASSCHKKVMHVKTALLAVFAVVATAQDFSSAPLCAQTCFDNSIEASGCTKAGGLFCLCRSRKYIHDVKTCVMRTCVSNNDKRSTLAWALSQCKSVGVSISGSRIF
ncbi:hypothetical protein XA68_11572 [Ophiocordyceps unilateralis]|uniref:CFEM domain-containing protein n=1 Tax=Ophiocordyceps unilateralis TaxID=268505 RepID=A0A2A9NXW3_OPHUN|nr:hypothetical protein XA68_11572 [Ophiocordyceps unilateralis]